MPGINHVILSGRITSDAVERESASGFHCRFHMSVPCGQRGKLWVCAHLHGNKAEDAFDWLLHLPLFGIEAADGVAALFYHLAMLALTPSSPLIGRYSATTSLEDAPALVVKLAVVRLRPTIW